MSRNETTGLTNQTKIIEKLNSTYAMKTLLFLLPLTISIYSCHTTTYEKDIQSSDFTNYYNKYQSVSQDHDKELLAQKHDTILLKSKELVIK